VLYVGRVEVGLEVPSQPSLNIRMKKDDTIYRVFQQLPGFVKEHHIRLCGATHGDNVPDAPAVNGPPSLSDIDHFLSEMKDVRQVYQDKVRIPDSRKDRPSVSRGAIDYLMNTALEGRCSLNVANLPEYMEGYVDGLNPLTMEKLRNGEFSVQAVLDLHGLSVDDAQDAFVAFIARSIRKRVCCVRIIHGRGLKSTKAPVLKGRLKEWIIKAMHRKWVVAFCSPKMADGGPGATTILLRLRPEKKKLHIIG
jgi:DNA-nicking Smr family endonuclease